MLCSICFCSCKSILSSDVGADLSSVGIILSDEYMPVQSSKGITNGHKLRSFIIKVSDADAAQIVSVIKEHSGYVRLYTQPSADAIIIPNDTVNKEIAYSYKQGYALYMVERNIFARSVYIDTVNKELHFNYKAKLF